MIYHCRRRRCRFSGRRDLPGPVARQGRDPDRRRKGSRVLPDASAPVHGRGARRGETLLSGAGRDDPLLTVRTGVRVKSLDREAQAPPARDGRGPHLRPPDPRPRRGPLSAGHPRRPAGPRDLSRPRSDDGAGGEGLACRTPERRSSSAAPWWGSRRRSTSARPDSRSRSSFGGATSSCAPFPRNPRKSSKTICGKMGIRIAVNSPLEDHPDRAGGDHGHQGGGQMARRRLPSLSRPELPPTSRFWRGRVSSRTAQLVVSPALQTADPRIFAAGDVAVIDAAGGARISPNTWPQAVSQGRTAAENLYRKTPVPHRDLTRINAMELDGLAMVILGPPVAGAEVISYARPEERVRRELFLRRRKTGGRRAHRRHLGRRHAPRPDQRRTGDHFARRPRSSGRDREASSLFPNHAGRREALILSPTRLSYDHS